MSFSVEAELQAMLAIGDTISDDVLKKELIRNVVYRASDMLAVGTQVIPSRNFGGRHVQNWWPGTVVGQYPMGPGSVADTERITWTPWDMTLWKGQVAFMLNDEAKVDMLEQYQNTVNVKRAAEALAYHKDRNIIDAIIAGAFATNAVAVAAGNEWDGGAATADPEGDIVNALNNVYANSNCTTQELKNCHLIIPANVYGELLKLKLIGNVQQRMDDYLQRTFGLQIWPTRYTDQITHPGHSLYGTAAGISDDAYLVLFGEDTGVHGVLQTDKIPMSESERIIGAGDKWVITQYFNTRIVPNSTTDATNYRIAAITNVT